MKKKLLRIAVIVGLVVAPMASIMADEGLSVYSTSITSYTPTAYDPADTVTPLIAGGARIAKILISNNDLTVPQTITFYENATSTTACTSKWSVDLDSVTATVVPYPADISFPVPADKWHATNLTVRKSSASSTVKVTIFYK